MKTIDVEATYREETFNHSEPGAVFHLLLHGLKHSAELRQNPPRIRTLEKGKQGKLVQCELLDPWPDAPGSIPVPVHDVTNRWPNAK